MSPNESPQFDIGFNYQVGNKWPTKAWPMEHWKALEKKVQNEYCVSWQQGLADMNDYFQWINNCRVIVTNDSFGMHLAIALKKKLWLYLDLHVQQRPTFISEGKFWSLAKASVHRFLVTCRHVPIKNFVLRQLSRTLLQPRFCDRCRVYQKPNLPEAIE